MRLKALCFFLPSYCRILMMKLHKSLFLLLLIALVGCTSRNESSIDSTSSREYPIVDPVFSLHVYEADDAEAESFIVGNSYLAVVGVDNYKEGAYVFNDDFSFSYNENVFDIDPYDYDYGYGFASYRFVISVKADSDDNAITVNHLNKEIGTIKKDIVECTAKFSYYRYDFYMNGVNPGKEKELRNEIVLISSKEEFSHYYNMCSNFLRSDAETDAFYENNNLLYMVIPTKIAESRFEGYYINDGKAYFKVSYYFPVGDPTFEYDGSFTTFCFVIGKQDGNAISDFLIHRNYRHS